SCTATASTTVIVNPLPIPTVGSNSPVCVGATLNLNSGGGTGYSWIGPNAFTGNTQNPSITNVTAANGGVYTVTVTDVNSCTATASTTVIVNPLPIPVSTNNGPLCVTNSLELSVSNAVSYLWSGPNGFTSSSQNPILSNVTMSENGVYTVTVTDVNGCTASTSTNVSISPSLSFSPTSNSPVCEGGTLSFTSSPGMSHVWSGPNGFSSNIENPSISAVTLNAAGTYTVTVTSLQGCTGSAFLNVVVNPVPIVNLGNDTLICGSISVQLDAGNAGSSYLWNDASSMQTLSVNGPGTYSVLVTDANGCSTTDQITITNETLPVVDLGLDQIVCEGAVVVLDATNSNATYLWNTGATTPTLSISTDGTYTVTVYKCNTSVTDQVQITVDEIELQVQNQVNPDCGMTNGEISLNVNGGVGTLTYIWQQLPSETGSVVSGLVEGSYDAIVTDAQGCTDAITVTLICISPEVIIPQFISPNGDGKNDVLVIQNLQIAYPRNSLKIYNRWGNEVYAASPYQNDWDGRCNTGLSLGTALLPAGTYFYVLDLHGDSSDVRSGFIELQP
ncbi:MAG: gliding motility-associated C-terminal domain-containing protein, partial [Flavobacteriales bacterium]|nr:gliding motility-associated C-terminal domain-containing protein [Flavobacteriales bacterium]